MNPFKRAFLVALGVQRHLACGDFEAHPKLRGVIADQPHVLERARQRGFVAGKLAARRNHTPLVRASCLPALPIHQRSRPLPRGFFIFFFTYFHLFLYLFEFCLSHWAHPTACGRSALLRGGSTIPTKSWKG